MNVSDADETIQEGDTVQVFLYTNRRGELTATMQMPNMTWRHFRMGTGNSCGRSGRRLR